uniref:Interleukin n=1 Tax=Mola mola TaxID=94237 RepID=A0A3Q3WEI7_MOLML
MTSFMTAPPAILGQRACPGDQRRAVRVNLTSKICNCLQNIFTSTCAASLSGTEHVMVCLKKLRHAIEVREGITSDIRLTIYSENCKHMSLRCYMLELIMAIDEEEIVDNSAECIIDFFSDKLPQTISVGCPPCEAYSLKNITVFLERLNNLLQELNSG